MLRGTSLLEAVVASAVFLTIFTLTVSILPQLIVRGDDASLVVEAEYRVEEAFGRYETGVWPCGEYVERYEWGEVTVRVERHRDFRMCDMCQSRPGSKEAGSGSCGRE